MHRKEKGLRIKKKKKVVASRPSRKKKNAREPLIARPNYKSFELNDHFLTIISSNDFFFFILRP